MPPKAVGSSSLMLSLLPAYSMHLFFTRQAGAWPLHLSLITRRLWFVLLRLVTGTVLASYPYSYSERAPSPPSWIYDPEGAIIPLLR